MRKSDSGKMRLIGIAQDGYFRVNTGLMIGSKKEIAAYDQYKGVEMTSRVIEGYLPVLSESEIKANRHRDCHKLPENMRALFTKLRLNVEMQHIEIKLYEGYDFDFQTRPQSGA